MKSPSPPISPLSWSALVSRWPWRPIGAIRAGMANLDATSGVQLRREELATVEAEAMRLSRLTADLRKQAELETRPLKRSPVHLADHSPVRAAPRVGRAVPRTGSARCARQRPGIGSCAGGCRPARRPRIPAQPRGAGDRLLDPSAACVIFARLLPLLPQTRCLLCALNRCHLCAPNLKIPALGLDTE